MYESKAQSLALTTDQVRLQNRSRDDLAYGAEQEPAKIELGRQLE